MKILKNFFKNINASNEDLAAEELAEQSETRGSTLIEEIERGKHIQVTGVVKSLIVKPNSQNPSFEIEVFDGSGILIVIWQGRRKISGIEPGTQIEVEGRITHMGAKPCLHNPIYKILKNEKD